MNLPDSLSLSTIPSLLAASLVLLLGTVLCRKIGFLSRYSIPSPIVGGLVFALVVVALGMVSDFRLTLETTAKPYLLLLFFASIGLTADFRLLAKGGVRLLWFLLALAPFLFAQNVVGIGVAEALGMHPLMGLVGGTITLIGGHGTGAAYAERFAEVNNIQSVMELTMTAATLGLVLGGIIGGPVGEWLVKRHRLTSKAKGGKRGGAAAERPQTAQPVSVTGFIGALAAAFVALLVGQALGELFEGGVITLPSFLWCLIIGLVIRNGGDLIGLRVDPAAADLIGSVSLSIFLAWTMMALDLATVVQTAGALLIVLAFQAVLIAIWAVLVCFRFVGRDYEAAVISAAFIGFAMGATATAIANMQAITQRHGPAPQAFIIVPIVGAFLIDIMNALVLTVFLSLAFMGGG
ncbi:MAG: sodium/glutamate symporter [Reyranellaceae bacterium]